MTTYRITQRGTILVCLVSLAWLTACGIYAVQTVSAPHTYPPCVTEDAPGPCYWDAPTRGNGIGHPFIVTPDQLILYTE